MRGLHNKLSETSTLYSSWHKQRVHHVVHWAGFIVVSWIIALAVTAQIDSVAFVNKGDETVNTAQVSTVSAKPGTLLVKFRKAAKAEEIERLLASVKAKVDTNKNKEIQTLGIKTITFPDEANQGQVKSVLQQRGGDLVEFAEVDSAYQLELTPNDPSYSSQWHLPKISSPLAWDSSVCLTPVTIAILDTGVNASHADLASNIVQGWNFYDNNAETTDVYGHGTAVAGTAAAVTNNGTGVAGSGWGCKVMPIRISDTQGYGYTSLIANGLTWAADRGARVANVSYQVSQSATVKTAAQYFASKGGVVTISAGNYGTSHDSLIDNQYALTVSATSSNDTVASWSDYGGGDIDLCAPGSGIYTTDRSGGYASWSGTSFAAPLTAGATALVISANSSLTAPQVQQIMRTSLDSLSDPKCPRGRLNLAQAVTTAINTVQPPGDSTPPTASINSPVNNSTVSGQITVTVSAGDNVAVSKVELKLGSNIVGTDTASPYEFNINTTNYVNGPYVLTAVATDTSSNNTASAPINITVSNVADTEAPNGLFITPQEGAALTGSVKVTIQASDNVAVASVDFFVDNALQRSWLSSSNTATFSINKFNTKSFANGFHVFRAVIRDTANNTKEVTLNVTTQNAASGGRNR